MNDLGRGASKRDGSVARIAFRFRRLAAWCTRLLRPGRTGTEQGRLENEIDEELGFHFEMRVSENLATGMTRADAESEARRRLGELRRIRQQGRRIRAGAARSSRWRRTVDEVRTDVGFAVRNARRRPGFTALVVTTLALGIGANTAMFSVVNAVVLRPLPYPDPERIALVLGIDFISAVDVQDLRNGVDAADPLALFDLNDFDLTGVPEPQRLRGMAVTEGFFDVLGIRAEYGRTLVADDHRADATPTVVLGHGLWRRISGDPQLVGETIRLDGRNFVVVGVMPAGFRFELYDSVEIWSPTEVLVEQVRMGIARLAEGATLDRLNAQLGAFAEGTRAATAEPGTPGQDVGVTSAPERDDPDIYAEQLVVGRGSKQLVLTMSAAVGLVLLIACVNVANLLLSRIVERRGELGIRAALGAGRSRLARQILTESVLLALAGGAIGVSLASMMLSVLAALPGSDFIWKIEETSIDGFVLGVSFTATLVVGLLFGSAPVFALRRDQLAATLRSSSRGATAAHRRLRSTLVVAQVAIALTLVIGTGLFVRTLTAMLPADPGFETGSRVVVEIEAARLYPDEAVRQELYRSVIEGIRSLPGVEAVAAASFPPYASFGPEYRGVSPAGTDEPSGRAAALFRVSPGYFEVLEIPIERGRGITAADRTGPGAAVINATMAEQLWPGDEEVVGRSFVMSPIRGEGERAVYTVVGVASDPQLIERDVIPRPLVWTHFETEVREFSVFIAKTRVPPEATFSALRQVVRELAPDLPVARIIALDDLMSDSVRIWRFIAAVMTIFGGTALLLALVGISGLISFSVARRTREFGVRRALGARSTMILTMLLGEGMRLVAAGALLGLAGAVALGRFVESWLVGVEPTDLTTFGVVTSLFLLVTAASCLWPALRATRVDPLVALRDD